MYNCVAQSDCDGESEKDGMAACCKIDNLAMAAAVANGDYGYGERIQTRKLPDLPCTPESTGTHYYF